MKFSIQLTNSAIEDLNYYRKSERRFVSAAIERFLADDANVETKRRKQLRPNELSSWELRIDDYRVFYDIEGETVKIIAVGHKEHGNLFIRGEQVEL